MNNTKWHELLNDIREKMPDINLQYKTFLEKESSDVYWELYGDEEIDGMNLAKIEWLRIKHVRTSSDLVYLL
ncbi:MAG: hypothetical protein E7505_11035 [Ruminococcus sp.]|nr:hypothetical protein [Ruminococcus sp.]